MKITIDLEDFWMESDSEGLTEDIKSHIVMHVKQDIWSGIKKLVEEHCEVQIKKEIEKGLYQQLNLMIAESLKTDQVKKRYSNNEVVSVQEWVKGEIERVSIDREFLQQFVTKTAANFGKEMKNRYDLLFASQLVAKMNETGLLKENVANLLLEKPKSE